MMKNNKGVALAVSFLVIVVLLILGSAFIIRSVGEKTAADKEKKSIQAFYLAEAGANEALNKLDILINSDLMLTVNSTNPQVLANNVRSYDNSNDGLVFLYNYTKKGGTNQFVCSGNCSACQNCSNCQNCSVITHNGQSTPFGQGNYQYTISVNENGEPVTVMTDVWDFPYNYKVSSTGTVAGSSRNVILSGDFTVRVQHDNFARFALFDVHHMMPSYTPVWFKNTTNFSGPVHTNDRFSFYGNPSGTFNGLVTQHLTTARFYNYGGLPLLLDADSNPPKDVPIFNAGYQRGVNEINLESSVTQQDLRNQAQGQGGVGCSSDAICVNNDGSNVLGGILVSGDSTVQMGKAADDEATYTITQGTTTKIITVNYTNSTTTVQTVGGTTNTYNGKPDGKDNLGTIIYVDGAIDSLKGTVQRNSQVTVSSQSKIKITDHIMYEQYNSGPPPNADDKTNLLGILSWGGDVIIGDDAPSNVNIHGTVMARNGIFTAENWDTKCSSIEPPGCGIATLLGGAITDFYGAFGTFDPSTGEQVSGYGRNFVYDGRMGQGQAPPYFPSMKTFIAFSNDIADKVTWQEGGI